jgi:hypothetical protein
MSPYRPPLDTSTYQGLVPDVADPGLAEGFYDRPQRAGIGPLECSTNTALAISPQVIFDVNGYYRAFGFAFPYTNITRKALRLAYHELRGEESVWLTAVFRMLLDPAKRGEYDRAPFGRRWLDEVEIALVLEEAKREAARRDPSPSNLVTYADLLKLRGLVLEDDLAVPPAPDQVENYYPDGEDNEPLFGHTEDPWLWGYYRWSTGRADTDRLGRWQQMLITEFAAQEVKVKFCVGYIGRSRTDSRFVVARTYGVRAIYLREDLEPDREMAVNAVSSTLSDN